ncbi:CaiB/BaiF CoA transferase family protein [Henriciella mobilis]|uniref:CoA transferase n=1 Tax=Henriciella mobilis TaxID=2305467 RepID=A0A399RJ11_9PROT|nr:CaiB/BaiF CoA-transferase family protein [Henriciella mobilis]RIJ29822.1 CoA transferase [Henriciella mobilis]
MISQTTVRGPLKGVKVVEFASIGPGPFCCMLLSDMGADILRIDRPSGVAGTGPNPVLQRGRPSIVLDLKSRGGLARARQACAIADVVVEGNRPGVMERLGLGPDDLHSINPSLIYGRMTGFGQEGPDASHAGHDINYLAATGALHELSEPGRPPKPPLNLLADFGGGALYLALGIAAALFERTSSGRGQIVDAAIVDGVTSLLGMVTGAYQSGSLKPGYEQNILSGAAPFYRTYECSDGRHVAVGSLEPQFYARFLHAMDATDFLEFEQRDTGHWPALTALLESRFRTKTADEWMEVLVPLDACINKVLTLDEAQKSPASRERGMYANIGGFEQPVPAPRLSRTPSAIQSPAAAPGEAGEQTLLRWKETSPSNP